MRRKKREQDVRSGAAKRGWGITGKLVLSIVISVLIAVAIMFAVVYFRMSSSPV